jgi:hypothetical protein
VDQHQPTTGISRKGEAKPHYFLVGDEPVAGEEASGGGATDVGGQSTATNADNAFPVAKRETENTGVQRRTLRTRLGTKEWQGNTSRRWPRGGAMDGGNGARRYGAPER